MVVVAVVVEVLVAVVVMVAVQQRARANCSGRWLLPRVRDLVVAHVCTLAGPWCRPATAPHFFYKTLFLRNYIRRFHIKLLNRRPSLD